MRVNKLVWDGALADAAVNQEIWRTVGVGPPRRLVDETRAHR